MPKKKAHNLKVGVKKVTCHTYKLVQTPIGSAKRLEENINHHPA